jgi:hypothetical protein
MAKRGGGGMGGQAGDGWVGAGLEKTRFFFKNPAQWFFLGFFGFFGFFWVFLGFFARREGF